MYLKNLTIRSSNGSLIRSVDFKIGLNLIVGLTLEEQGIAQPTNSIGKTTLLRSIDFCLGGKLTQFYQDSEFKSTNNTQILEFFTTHAPTFELTVSRTLDTISFKKNISRKIVPCIQEDQSIKLDIENSIDGNIYSSDDFLYELKNILFLSYSEKPTFRDLIQKFIRRDDLQISRILNYFHPSTAKNKIEATQLFLFGFNDIEAVNYRKVLQDQLKKENKHRLAFKTKIPKGLDQLIIQQRRDLEQLTNTRDQFRINDRYETDQDQLGTLQNDLKNLDNKIAVIYANIDVLKHRKEELENNKFVDNTDAIKLIYKEANLFDIQTHKKFEETIAFHNSMMTNEINYLTNRIQRETIALTELEKQRCNAANAYSELLSKLAEMGSLAEYTKINNQINELTSEIAKNQAFVSQLTESEKRIESLTGEIEDLNKVISRSRESLTQNIAVFNEYFSDYCHQLFNERYFLFSEFTESSVTLTVKQYQSHSGSGKKQSIVTAFDLSYIAFIQDPRVNLPYPFFATHDKIEVVDIAIIQKLSELANQSGGQLIVPLIADKFSALNKVEESVILKLSTQDRFFGI